ncbi:hypothetical protein RV11_GL003207 [Enterococcus phoeniculicola]|uniref:HTH cro/C1-type domain-containing protein n=1 Tax=Enterococcus phoeniculicola ATCC BAA-412 TaxID=1158610 RepID=R3TNA4_9ENTE|nr:helix-turn-helix domain-containing protein [Enterococcus phoeniculicola]EOL42974.1 hypothetical protein UC3_01951 [Enterococcus phoeniculicola ATCC BAA-412]EOT76668.1 hypothetical protein I589_01625 [Enterococcus phoeniculicola ATCC BAA-412]OJG72236.1 hypothetical protein RV11_GL003207 [Enterococcus phoeniculicola]
MGLEFNRHVGQKIKQRRKFLKVTQKELAEKVDSIAQTVSKIERGVFSPSFNSLIKICVALEMSPNDLIPEGHFHSIDDSFDIPQQLSTIDVLWQNANLCKNTSDLDGELYYLKQIINSLVKEEQDYYREFAIFLYHKQLLAHVDENLGL